MKKTRIVALIVSLVLIVVLVSLRASGALESLRVQNIVEHAGELRAFVQKRYVFSVCVYIATYVLVAVLAVFPAAVLTMLGGFLFGTFFGVIYTNIGATLGAVIPFLLARYSLGLYMHERYDLVKRFNQQFEQKGARFLLASRLIIIAPYFLVNIMAGLTRVSLWTFVWTTALGIFPASVVYAFAGKQFHHVRSAKDLFSLRMGIIFFVLACALFVPIIATKLLEKFRAERKKT